MLSKVIVQDASFMDCCMGYITTKEYARLVPTCKIVAKAIPSLGNFIAFGKCWGIKNHAPGCLRIFQCTLNPTRHIAGLWFCGNHANKHNQDHVFNVRASLMVQILGEPVGGSDPGPEEMPPDQQHGMYQHMSQYFKEVDCIVDWTDAIVHRAREYSEFSTAAFVIGIRRRSCLNYESWSHNWSRSDRCTLFVVSFP